MPNPIVRTLTIEGVTYDLQDNISGYITGITSSDVTTALGFTPYNATNPNGYTTNTGTITSVKTTAGAHTTINVSSGAANFNVPTKTSHLTNDSGFLTSYTETDPIFVASAAHGITSTDITNWNNKLDSYTETDPVFSASAAAGITSTDISNWNAKVSDTGKWNNVELIQDTQSRDAYYIPTLINFNSTSAKVTYATSSPSSNKIVLWDSNEYIYSTTPSANDNSTKVATTAYVDAAIPKVYSSTNTGGYLTMATLPIYDGTVV